MEYLLKIKKNIKLLQNIKFWLIIPITYFLILFISPNILNLIGKDLRPFDFHLLSIGFSFYFSKDCSKSDFIYPYILIVGPNQDQKGVIAVYNTNYYIITLMNLKQLAFIKNKRL